MIAAEKVKNMWIRLSEGRAYDLELADCVYVQQERKECQLIMHVTMEGNTILGRFPSRDEALARFEAVMENLANGVRVMKI